MKRRIFTVLYWYCWFKAREFIWKILEEQNRFDPTASFLTKKIKNNNFENMD